MNRIPVLVAAPVARNTQDVVVGIDPGKLFSGVGVQSSRSTLFLAHLILPSKAGATYVGWICGYTQTQKTKNVSVYDHNWRRIGQFSLNKVELLQRSTRLCVTA